MSRKIFFLSKLTLANDDNGNYANDKLLNLLILTRGKTRMTLTADTYGEDFLENGELDLFEEDPDHPCNQVELEIIHFILLILMVMVMSMSQGWGVEENCYSRSGEDIVKPLQV